MSDTFDDVYMGTALLHAQRSKAIRAKVGAVLVTKTGIIIPGYNGTPSGAENCCEDEGGKTHWYVLHAEANAILKLASSTQSAKGATLYLTLSPCKECSKLILQSGIKRLVYIDQYSDTEGLQFLENAQVEVLQISEENLK